MGKLARYLADARTAMAVEKYQERFTDPECEDCLLKPRSDSDYGRLGNCRYCRGEEK